MSWLFSQALVAEYSEDICSDGGASALSKSTRTAGMCWSPGRTMAASGPSRSGTMYAPLTDAHGAVVLMSFLAAFPAKTSAPQIQKGKASKAIVVASGSRWNESFARWDHTTSSWKTRQCSLFGGLESCSATWPRWGTMRSGECWEVVPSVRYKKASEYGSSLLRPTAQCWRAWTFQRLSSLIRKNHADGNLQEQSARCFHKMITPLSNEMLMLWPEGWTALEPLETAKFQQWLDSHGIS